MSDNRWWSGFLTSQGFVSEDVCMAGKFAEAIANAVVDEIQQNAQVQVSGGSSAGSHKISWSSSYLCVLGFLYV